MSVKVYCLITLVSRIHNFFSSGLASSIVSIQVGIFSLNICDVIIYVAQWWGDKHPSKRTFILVYDVISLIYYEHWTDKRKYFYTYEEHILVYFQSKIISCYILKNVKNADEAKKFLQTFPQGGSFLLWNANDERLSVESTALTFSQCYDLLMWRLTLLPSND